MGSKIDFPISYVTDYLLYSLDDNIHFDFVKGIIEGYGENVNRTVSTPREKYPRDCLWSAGIAI
jgi:hypothetical protein